MKKNSGRGMARLRNALGWSLAGLRAALKHEEAFRQEMIVAAVLLPVGLWLGKSVTEKAFLCGSIFLVLIVELLNSAIESAVDRVGHDPHPLSAQAKDLGSAAVFMALINMIMSWLLVLAFQLKP